MIHLPRNLHPAEQDEIIFSNESGKQPELWWSSLSNL